MIWEIKINKKILLNNAIINELQNKSNTNDKYSNLIQIKDSIYHNKRHLEKLRNFCKKFNKKEVSL